MSLLNCPVCQSTEFELKIIVHTTQGTLCGVPVPDKKGERVTFVYRCLKERCFYNRDAYEERAYEMEDIT